MSGLLGLEKKHRRLRILITNNALVYRAGTQVYVEDLCIYLMRAGHSPIVYSVEQGEFADSLRSQGIILVDDLSKLTFQPDIIHGHHHLEVASALVAFPETPCVAFCHGVIPWDEHPFPNIARICKYVAVGEPAKLRLLSSGIPDEKIVILPNFAADWRFTKSHIHERPIDKKHQKILVFGNYRQAASADIAKIADQLGIEVVFRGGGYGQVENQPEKLFRDRPIVFAYGKAAVEALYSGCTVILSSSTGIGEVVRSDNYEYLRSQNFGSIVCHHQPTPAGVKELLLEASQLCAGHGPALTTEQRNRLAARDVLETLSGLYQEAVAWYESQPRDEAMMEEYEAMSKYFRYLSVSRFNELGKNAACQAEELRSLRQPRRFLLFRSYFAACMVVVRRMCDQK